MKTWSFLCGFLILSACGTSADDPIVGAFLAGARTLSEPQKNTPDLAERRAEVLRDVAATDSDGPVLLVEIPKLDAVASLVIAARNGGAITWIDPSGVSLVTQDGIVISTRGLGNDLMIVDITGIARALNGGAPKFSRLHRYLDGEGQLGRRTFDCDLSKQEDQLIETCDDAKTKFQNTYTLKNARIVSSVQWLGPSIGPAFVEHLR